MECRIRRTAIAGQQVFVEKLVKLAKMVARESGTRPKKVCIQYKSQEHEDGMGNH